MSIQSHVAEISIQGIYGAIGSIGIPMHPILLRLKVVMVIFLGTILLILSAIAVARTGVMPEIVAPHQSYLPGNSLPQLPKNTLCVEYEYLDQSCRIDIDGQAVYVKYVPGSRKIVRTSIRVHKHKLGDLISAWGYPKGVSQSDIFIVVYWGTRSAVLYTDSLRPESPVEFIQYDLVERPLSEWQGFANAKQRNKVYRQYPYYLLVLISER